MSEPGPLRRLVLARLAEQRRVVRSLLALREQLQGSLFARYAECGKPACVCHTGRRHGPYYVLSARSAGRGGFSYLARERMAEARTLLQRYRRFRRGMARLRRLNTTLVRLLRRYQRASARRGGRRLGLAVTA